jgi:hypothetical protein
MKKSIYLIAMVFVSQFLFAGNTQSGEQSIFDLLNYQEVTEVTLEFEVEEMLSNRRNEEDFNTTFTFEDQKGFEQIWDAKINMRGRFRRTRCTGMPPLKLNFKKGDLKDAGLAKFDDFKLVTQCVQDESSAKDFLLREYLAYKMYNQLTDYSFRVQFLKINFKDKSSGVVEEQWGFIIEDTAELRERVNANKYDSIFYIQRDIIDVSLLKTVSMFEYMIGNLDWDVKQRFHNMKPIEKDGVIIPVPYDFDFSGLVSASYAVLNPNYAVKSIKDRLYLGYEEDLADAEATIELFKAKKDAIIDCIKDCNSLERDSRLDMIRYINSFYKELDDIKLPVKLSAN